MKLNNRVAIVTGGGQGVGKAIALELATQGAAVAIAEIDESLGNIVATEIRTQGYESEAFVMDVSSKSTVDEVCEKINKRWGQIDILINNAGPRPNVIPTMNLPLEEWDRVLSVGLTGVLLCSQSVGRLMMERETGTIVNIASVNGINPAACLAAYNVAKAGVINLTRTLALELAPYKIRVNAICPGPLKTDFHSVVMPQRAKSIGIETKEMIERVRTAIPLGRWGEPYDIAKMVSFLSSEDASWITGSIMNVHGGLEGVSATPPRHDMEGENCADS